MSYSSSSSSGSHSEGEIVERDALDKATTSLVEPKNTNIDRHSRKRSSNSRSPSPYRNQRRSYSRGSSRSPYRNSRVTKRTAEDDHYDRWGNDSRRFKVRYESPPAGTQNLPRNPQHSGNNRRDGEDVAAGGRPHNNRRSQSPPKSYRRHAPISRSNKQSDHWKKGSQQRHDRSGYDEGGSKISLQQSVRAQRQLSPDAIELKHDAESSRLQKPQKKNESTPSQDSSAKYVSSNSRRSGTNRKASSHVAALMAAGSAIKESADNELVDEATLIEERRKRREAIKAKHKDKAAPLLVQALAIDRSTPSTPQDATPAEENAMPASPYPSTPSSPKVLQEPSVGFSLAKDSDLANKSVTVDNTTQADEPSAADYDPAMDMQEDKIRQHQQQHNLAESLKYSHEDQSMHQDALQPDFQTPKVQDSNSGDFDMFGDDTELDMFVEGPNTAPRKGTEVTENISISKGKAMDMSMLDDCDDFDGYYKVILGEALDNRYLVQSNLGKGMFSGVVRATDQKTKKLVAIKLARNNEAMRKTGIKEIGILEKLMALDPEDKKHIIRLERHFEHKGHLCMVFENLNIDLREVLKKFGRDVGINLKAVREYARQMFLGLSLLRKCNILHADLKPDNMLVNEARSTLKICDLGSASDASENEVTQYLVSRFYRAPEIILGLPYDFAIDMWSVGCTLFELYTGKILFTGRSNNQMLRAIMECRGKFSHKLLRKGQFTGLHFDDLLNFRSLEKDRISGKDLVRILNFAKPTRDLKTRLMANVRGMGESEIKDLTLFMDLLDRCLNLNPEKRCTPSEALRHPFIARTTK